MLALNNKPEFKLTEGPKKSRPTITVTLDDKYHHYVMQAAKDDYDRPPSKWLKRLIQENLDTILTQ